MVALRHEDRPHRIHRRTPLRVVRLDDDDDAVAPLPLVRKDTLPEHTDVPRHGLQPLAELPALPAQPLPVRRAGRDAPSRRRRA